MIELPREKQHDQHMNWSSKQINQTLTGYLAEGWKELEGIATPVWP